MEQSSPFLLVQFRNQISATLLQPLVHTQRIKYLSFDISESYIALGASSGGLYIFNREPCSFQQIVPGQDGSVNLVQIAPNEKMIAFATNRGLFCILQYLRSTKSYNLQVHREHVGSMITCIKWNIYSTEVYVGDKNGKLSVVTLSDLIVKTMFQVPCFPLMKLDSQITQLDWSCNLLLVSTCTRCYICDTEKEEYRQIGQKLRDGDYGACFLNMNESTTSIELCTTEFKKRSLFHNVGEKQESFTRHSFYERLKIFCARPGARMWEVLVDGTVVKTHQYKQALDIPSTCIIQHHDKTNHRLQYLDEPQPTLSQPNFSKVFTIRKHFLLSFKSDSIIILNPQQCSAVLWVRWPKEIMDVRILGSYIYIWNAQEGVDVLFFTDVEKFILRCFVNRQYMLCADICVKQMTHLLQIVPYYNKLYLLSSLGEKIKDDVKLVSLIQPLLDKIKLCLDRKKKAQILENGIYVVDNDHLVAQQINDGHNNDGDAQIPGPITAGNTKNETIDTIIDFSHNVTKSLQSRWQQIEGKIFNTNPTLDSCPQLMLTPADKECSESESEPFHVFAVAAEPKIKPHTCPLFCDKNDTASQSAQTSVKSIGHVSDTIIESVPPAQSDKMDNNDSVNVERPKSTCSKKVGPDDSILVNEHVENKPVNKPAMLSSTNTLFNEPLTLGSIPMASAVKLDSPMEPIVLQLRTVELDEHSSTNDPYTILCLNEYFKLSKISKVFNNLSIDEILKQYVEMSRLRDVLKHLKEHIYTQLSSDDLSGLNWCNNLCLRSIELQPLPKVVISQLSPDNLSFVLDAFTDFNASPHLACKCGFPLPAASSSEISYYGLGATLVDIYWCTDRNVVWNLCKRVPYMWRKIFTHVDKYMFIPLLVQYSDLTCLTSYVKQFSDAQLANTVRYFVKMKMNICLKCDKHYEIGSNISWTNFALFLLKTSGSMKSIEYLQKYAQFIPPGALDPVFYQLCLISSLLGDITSIDLLSTATPIELSDLLDNMLASSTTDKTEAV